MSIDLPNFKVVILGASGSGKTVFLSSMYQELSTQGKYGFFLRVEDRSQRRELDNKFAEIVTGDKWPTGTRGISDWNFKCLLESEKGIFPTFMFTYYDYAGGLVNDEVFGKEIEDKFDKCIQKADAFLGLIDGMKVLRSLEGDQKAWNELFIKDIKSLAMHMQNRKIPIHFIISKWDLIESIYSLDNVVDKLLTIPAFRRLVNTRKSEKVPVRIIPVSSIGRGFAKLENGNMIKTGKDPEPFQVEMPLACIIPDLLEMEIPKIDRGKLRIDNAQMPDIKVNLTFRERIGEIISTSIRIFNSIKDFLPINLQFADKVIERFADHLASGAKNKRVYSESKRDEILTNREKELRKIEEQESAINLTFSSFVEIREFLEYSFPASTLS